MESWLEQVDIVYSAIQFSGDMGTRVCLTYLFVCVLQ